MAFSNGIHYLENRQYPSSVPVIFLHGAGGNALSWPPAIRTVHGVNFYFPEFPGHGRSTGASAHSIEGMAAILESFMDSLSIRRAVMVGHSMGGAVALWMAINRRDRVLGLVLISTAALFKVDPTFLMSPLQTANREIMLRKLVDRSFSPQIPLRTKDLAYQRLLEVRPSVLYNDFLACSEFDAMPGLSKVRQACLILGGSEDQMVQPGNWYLLQSKISKAELTILDGAGHHLMFERPFEISEAILNFIKKISHKPGGLPDFGEV